jgi:hypothetical protein
VKKEEVMRGRRLRLLLATGVLVALIALALSACGGGAGQDSAKGQKGNKAAANYAQDNPLVGTWRRVRTCDEFVRNLKQAGLAEMIPAHEELVAEFGTGSAAQSREDSEDSCQGVNGRLPHDHVFYKDGRFASLNQDGEFVDDGHYKFVNDRTIKFGNPPGNLVHFRFSDDHDTVTFDLEIPDMDNCSQQCRDDTFYRIAVFYPGLPWKRVPPEDQWPGEV